MKVIAQIALPVCVAVFPAGAGATERLALYQGRAIVTGTGEATRQTGFASALGDVLAQVSGDQRLIGDPRVTTLEETAGSLVSSFSYRDRMEGIPFHDEQGSRDRPHDLTVTFDRAEIDAALRALGSEPWTSSRPTVALLIRVENAARTFTLASDGAFGIDMRIALDEASSRIGLPVTVPTASQLADSGFSTDPAAPADEAALAAAATAAGGDHPLAGSLTWSDTAMGWVAEWHLYVDGERYRWGTEGVSFDAAFRNALRGAAQVLSGNGAPD